MSKPVLWFSTDVESDGPCPALYSMISFGSVYIDSDGALDQTFYGQCQPLLGAGWQPEALAVSGHSREEVMAFERPSVVIPKFVEWVEGIVKEQRGGRAMFIADNNGFDWQFINYYCHKFAGRNPFGFSSTNLNSLYKGLQGNMRKNIRHLRTTKHTHHPVDDAKGNTEAFLKVREMMEERRKLEAEA